MTSPLPRPRAGFTLLEALVVIFIILITSGLALVALQAVRESSNRVKCQARIKDLVLAVHLYHNAKGTMPPYLSGKGSDEMVGSWFVHLLPYVGYMDLYDSIKNAQKTATPTGDFQLISAGVATAKGVSLPELSCPSDYTAPASDDPRTNFLGNWYAFSEDKNGVYGPPQPFKNLWDGLSQVVLFAEGQRECNGLPRMALYSFPYHNFGITQDGKASDDPSYAPNDYTMFQIRAADCDKWRSQTAHAMMPVGMADGTSRWVSPSISPDVWKLILKPRDGNPANGDW